MPNTAIIADDDPAMRAMLRSLLVVTGMKVVTAEDGLEAVQYASRMNADLVMLDVSMPRLDGLQACQRIRNLPAYSATPIVICTSYDEAECERMARNVRATHFISKLANPEMMVNQLKRIIPMEESVAYWAQSAALSVREASMSMTDLEWRQANFRVGKARKVGLFH